MKLKESLYILTLVLFSIVIFLQYRQAANYKKQLKDCQSDESYCSSKVYSLEKKLKESEENYESCRYELNDAKDELRQCKYNLSYYE